MKIGEQRMKLSVKITSIILWILLISFVFVFYNNQIEINYNKNGTYEENLTISFKHRILNFGQDIECKLKNDSTEVSTKMENNSCTLSIPEGNYTLFLENTFVNLFLFSKRHIIITHIEDFEINQDEMYLVINESESLDLVSNSNSVTWEYDEEVISLDNNVVTGLKDGKTTLVGKTLDGVTDSVDVVVTSLLNKQTSFDYNKEYIACEQYSQSEARLLDRFLEYRINRAGYQTRAGVVEAARFLTLSLQYRIPYFFENGRLHWSGVHYIDGEGRYYHKGLYLSTDKYEDIGPVKDGPAMWGCDLINRDDTVYELFKPYPNGLDCSGFVTWALLNGGFDIGDVGANDKPLLDDSKYYGEEFIPVNMSTLNSGKVKPRDIIAISGHTALIIGIDDEHYYVSESLASTGGVVAKTYSKEELIKKFTYIHLMDSIYKEDGNLTLMW